MMLTQDRLTALFRYDPDTGLFWRVKKRKGAELGVPAGTVTVYGYVSICIDYRKYLAHRLAFLYMTGHWPEQEVDHINRQHADNRWANLRGASPSENQQNRPMNSNNKSGFKGVSYNRRDRRFVAFIAASGKTKNIGSFLTAEAAAEAYAAAKAEMHKFHPHV